MASVRGPSAVVTGGASAVAPAARVGCGNVILDGALGGGLPAGSLVLLRGASGSGAREFAFGALKAALSQGRGGLWASALRSAGRVAREAAEALPADLAPRLLATQLRARSVGQDCLDAASEMGEGHVLVIETASALHGALGDDGFAALVAELGEAAFQSGALVLLLHTGGSLQRVAEARLEEACDAVLTFSWREGSTMRRRILGIDKMPGHAPVLAAEEVPIFELGVHQGGGISVSRVKNLA